MRLSFFLSLFRPSLFLEVAFRRLFILAAIAAWAAPAVANPVPVGVASIVSAGVQRQASGQPLQPLMQGQSVFEGDVIDTTAGGYAYLTTVDQAFLSVRPGSRLHIVAYRVDPQTPRNNQIRLDLLQGTARWVSGRGANAARDRFRLNTPVAAIGVRGTDFSVFADASVTSASVRAGRIAVSPFNQACQPSGLGPCPGESVVDLAPGSAPVVQVLAGESRPQLLQSLDLSPDRLVPPALDEQPAGVGSPRAKEQSAPAASAEKPAAAAAPAASAEKPVAAASAPAAVAPAVQAAASPATSGSVAAPQSSPSLTNGSGTLTRKSEIEISSTVSAGALLAETQVPRPEDPGLPKPAVAWGRWQALASLPAGQGLDAFLIGREFGRVVGPFVVAREQGPFAMPSQGVFAFQLVDYQALLITGAGPQASTRPATVVNPSLKIDFGSNQFSTEIGIQGPDGRVTPLVAQGSVERSGALRSDERLSNGIVSGVLAGPEATEAGYVFHRSVLGGAESAFGVTRWAR
ncbi:MAG: FecR family protein [Burkholderiaceae bacterium]